MTRTLLAALFLLCPAAVRAQVGCQVTTGALRLEKPRVSLTALSEATRCQNRNWDIMAASVPVLGSTQPVSLPFILTSTIGALTPDGIRIASAAYFAQQTTHVGSATFNAAVLVSSSVQVNDTLAANSTAYFNNGRVWNRANDWEYRGWRSTQPYPSFTLGQNGGAAENYIYAGFGAFNNGSGWTSGVNGFPMLWAWSNGALTIDNTASLSSKGSAISWQRLMDINQDRSVKYYGGMTSAGAFTAVGSMTVTDSGGLKVSNGPTELKGAFTVNGASSTFNDKLQVGGTFYVQNAMVGIGTALPCSTCTLHVAGAGTSLAGGSLRIDNHADSVALEIVQNDSGGNDPGIRVRCPGSDTVNCFTMNDAADAVNAHHMRGNGNAYHSGTLTASTAAIQGQTFNTMDGKVGIGTASPLATLHNAGDTSLVGPVTVNGSTLTLNHASTPELGFKISGTAAGSVFADSSGIWVDAASGDGIKLRTNNGFLRFGIGSDGDITAYTPVTVVSSLTVTGIGSTSFFQFPETSKATLQAMTPGATGRVYYCTDCANNVNAVVSTGTAGAAQFDSWGIKGTVWQ